MTDEDKCKVQKRAKMRSIKSGRGILNEDQGK